MGTELEPGPDQVAPCMLSWDERPVGSHASFTAEEGLAQVLGGQGLVFTTASSLC